MGKLKAAVCGFRHGHISSLVKGLKEHPEVEITAACEEEPEKCSSIIEKCGLEITHPCLDGMLAGADFDIVALGDYYAARGRHAIKAMEAGKHVFSDKPLCTGISELERIRELSESRNLSVIVALTLRYSGILRAAGKALKGGAVGEVTNVIVTGHHGLMFRSGRPDWYFEKGKHGGTINDIMVHGIDAVPWLCGIRFSSVLSALGGHFEPEEVPFFQDIGKAFLELDNGGGVFIDASYKAPAGHRSGWDFFFWGTEGFMKFGAPGEIVVQRRDEPERNIPREDDSHAGIVEDLVSEIEETPGRRPVLTTGESLLSTLNTLKVQEAADTGKHGVPLD